MKAVRSASCFQFIVDTIPGQHLRVGIVGTLDRGPGQLTDEVPATAGVLPFFQHIRVPPDKGGVLEVDVPIAQNRPTVRPKAHFGRRR